MNNLKKHYINPQDLIEYLYEADAIDGRTAKLINQFPEEDVVEVVRCRECKYADTLFPATSCTGRSPDFFCADGKRKDGGQDE